MEKEKIKISPEHTTYTDSDHSKFTVEIELPGVKKENIIFKMHDESFYLTAPIEDKLYVMNHGTCHPVIPEQAEATYKNGLLKVVVPFKDLLKDAVDIKIG